MITNPSLKAILITMLNNRIIGGKHTPEDNLIKSKTKWSSSEEKKQFKQEYKKLINEFYIIRLKKRTSKGFDWHISLNPRKLKEIYKLIE